MILRVALIVSLLMVCITSFGQYQLKGIVMEAPGKKPLGNVTVFSADLNLGVASTSDGTFVLHNLKTSHFLLQVSHVGYETSFFHIQIPRDSVLEIMLHPSFVQMEEVVVTGTHSQSPKETSFHVDQLRGTDIRNMGAMSISDAVARIPGVSQLTTGPGISKPVIRGLYGNRIQVNVNGVRFDNQQWQDEHGLGLSDMGVDKVEIIKGPASVLYGSDAIGGVLNITEEKPASLNTTQKDFSIKTFSNTYGLSANYGVKKTTDTFWWTLRGGLDNHADYQDGKNQRVLNSRFASYNLKASIGKTKGKWVNANHVFVSYSKFGFVFDSLSRKVEDARLSRSFDGPHHQVFIAQLSTENTFFQSEKKKIKLNGGLSTNLRQEDEGGGGISLSMLLNAASLVWQTTRYLPAKSEWIYGASGFAQTNTNFGGRIIVPNAFTAEASAFSFYKHRSEKWFVEGGARFDQKWISTFTTGQLNTLAGDHPTQDVRPFSRPYTAMNISGGSTFEASDLISFRANVSSGYRPGNLAELSSNGLHEGSLRWEIGKPNAAVEQNLNSEFSVLLNSGNLKASASVYHNRFWNYIYLAPTGQEYFGFNIYRFEQTDATLKGGEIQLDWVPNGSPLEMNSSFSLINARKSNGGFLPFIPANKLSHEFRYHVPSKGNWSNATIRLGGLYVFNQSHPAQFETTTPRYFLLNAGASATVTKMEISLTGSNLLNNNYYDHLSRFKYYGIHNMGRNIVLSIYFKI